MSNNTKNCIECHTEKLLTLFEKKKASKDGRTNKCNKCIRGARKKREQQQLNGTYKRLLTGGFGVNDLRG